MDELSRDSIFFDLQRAITTDAAFINRINAVWHDITKAEASDNKLALRHHVMDLLRLCDFNPSLLTGYFFPRFVKNLPMTLHNRPHAFAMMGVYINGQVTICAGRQIGKCVTGDTAVVITDDANNKKESTIEELFNYAKSL